MKTEKQTVGEKGTRVHVARGRNAGCRLRALDVRCAGKHSQRAREPGAGAYGAAPEHTQ